MLVKNLAKFFIVIIVILIIGWAFYYYFLSSEDSTEEVYKNIFEAESIANWKIYRNDVFDYSFKYPGEQFEVFETKDEEGEAVTYLKKKSASLPILLGIEFKTASSDKTEHLEKSMIWIYGSASKEPPTPIIDCETAKNNVILENTVLSNDIEVLKLYNKNGVIGWYIPYNYTFLFIEEGKIFLISFIQPDNSSVNYLPFFNQVISTFEIL